jgi:hypothetical protein
MDGATKEHLRLMHRVIKFVLSTKERGIMVKPNTDSGVIVCVDSDFAGPGCGPEFRDLNSSGDMGN